jgi:NTP pyrophosphatase (non-canonical NTP hydrolase)
MNFNEYQKIAHRTAVYPKEFAFQYLTYGLIAEAGELAGNIAKWYRGDIPDGPGMPEVLEHELGDVLWFLTELCTELGLDLDVIALMNLEKLDDRANRNVIRGSGDNR